MKAFLNNGKLKCTQAENIDKHYFSHKTFLHEYDLSYNIITY